MNSSHEMATNRSRWQRVRPLLGATLVACGVLALMSCASSAGEANRSDAVAEAATWDKTFPKSDLV